MQAVADGYRSFDILVQVNWDRILYICVIAAALFGGAALGSLIT